VNLLLDMNLSPVLARPLSSHGHDVVHRSEVGDYRATDVTIHDDRSRIRILPLRPRRSGGP
jgi:predicted nuclease of predicted toxin-antitoxin system